MMKKKYVMPIGAQQIMNLSNCLMTGSGDNIQDPGKIGSLDPMPSVAARRLYV